MDIKIKKTDISTIMISVFATFNLSREQMKNKLSL